MQNGKSSKDIKEIQLKPALRRERTSKEVLHCSNNNNRMQIIVMKGEEEINMELPDNVSIL